jgi:hypothetical protein
LIIGKQGENLKSISSATGTKIFMPQKNSAVDGTRIVEICGDNMEDCHFAETKIRDMISE